MSMPSQMDVIVAPETGATGSYVDWPAIIAGVILASAISLVLLTFGSAIGLSFINFRSAEGVMPLWIGMAAALWLLWVQVSSFMAGAYLTGRLRRRHNDASEHESDVRDGAHGLLVWGGSLVVGAIIATGGIGAAANAVGSAATTLTTAASNVADETSLDPNAYFVDTLFRVAPGAAPAVADVDTSELRGEAGRILLQGAVDGVGEADRAYLAQLVAANTGLTEEEASARVNEVMTAVEQAKAQAVAAAENARKMGVLAAFLTAASLLVSAAAAFWAAQKGGNHRDEGTAFLDVFRRT